MNRRLSAGQCNGGHDMSFVLDLDPQSFPLLGGYLNLPGGSIYFVGGNDSCLGPHDQFFQAKYVDRASLKPRRRRTIVSVQ